MSKIVAIEGDCELILAPTWTGTVITYFKANKITVGGTKVILGALSILTSPNPPFTDIVILIPLSNTKLTDNGVSVLRVGDIKTSPQGNVLKVKDDITNKLKSS